MEQQNKMTTCLSNQTKSVWCNILTRYLHPEPYTVLSKQKQSLYYQDVSADLIWETINEIVLTAACWSIVRDLSVEIWIPVEGGTCCSRYSRELQALAGVLPQPSLSFPLSSTYQLSSGNGNNVMNTLHVYPMFIFHWIITSNHR